MDFTFSASAVSTFRLCPRKYYFAYVKGFKSEAGGGAALGSRIHKELELWLTEKKAPAHPRAKALLPLLPLPSKELLVELPFQTLYPVGLARGFIDLLIPKPSLVKLPKGFPSFGGPVVWDHKSTKKIDEYAKTEEELLTDPQAALYGVEARLRVADKVTDVPNVDIALGYTQTSGALYTKVVHLRQSLPILEDSMGLVLADARAMGNMHSCSEDDVPFNRAVCDTAFGGCPHRSICKAYATVPGPSVLDQLDDSKEEEMPSALERIKAINAAKKAAQGEPAAETVVDSHAQESNGVVQPSPEPALEPFDTSKAVAGSAVNPPDAAENLKPPKARKAASKTNGESDLVAVLTAALTSAISEKKFKLASTLLYTLEEIESPPIKPKFIDSEG